MLWDALEGDTGVALAWDFLRVSSRVCSSNCKVFFLTRVLLYGRILSILEHFYPACFQRFGHAKGQVRSPQTHPSDVGQMFEKQVSL